MGKETLEIRENNPRTPQPGDPPVLHAMLSNIGKLNIQDELDKDPKIRGVYNQLTDYYEAQADERESLGKRAPDPIDSRLSALESIAYILGAKNSETSIQHNEQPELEILAEEFGLWVWDKYPDDIISYLEHLTHKNNLIVARAHTLADRLRKYMPRQENQSVEESPSPVTPQVTVITQEQNTSPTQIDTPAQNPPNPKTDEEKIVLINPAENKKEPRQKPKPKPKPKEVVIYEGKPKKPPTRKPTLQPERPHTQNKQQKLESRDPEVKQKIEEYVKWIGEIIQQDVFLNSGEVLERFKKSDGKNAAGWAKDTVLRDLSKKKLIKPGMGRSHGKPVYVYGRTELVFAKYASTVDFGISGRFAKELMRIIETEFEKFDAQNSKQ